ncbi:fructosamine kinase family protein [Nakamurella deserti]|uniref:fructosamine kinase family protein n=1 Tax=Nakamurella deserti TaxID=2164074 RepID=UPI000DBE61B8|nr:fructosamine kinase family protein [Nakamurella deserti]
MSFRKQRDDAPAGFFEAEAAGLRWLAAAPDGATVVDVLDVGPGFIELPRVRDGAAGATAARAFGAALSRTHDAGAAAWGAPPDGWTGPTFIGRQEMSCRPAASFGAFYAGQRVLPYLRKAVDRGHVDAADARAVERVCDRLVAGDFDDGESPARIHGDLWSGNVLWTAAGVCLIDPAAHGGHRETDLAMLALFGAPRLRDILDGYSDTHPPADGWRDRVPLHQLHPLAVHAASHGRGYAQPLADAARAVLAL